MGGTGAVAPRCIHVHGVAPGPRVTLLHPGSLRPGLGLWPASQSQARDAKRKKNHFHINLILASEDLMVDNAPPSNTNPRPNALFGAQIILNYSGKARRGDVA